VAALILDLGKEESKNYLNLIIPTLQREIVIGQTGIYKNKNQNRFL
jgi:hypothetical protein